MEGFVHSVESFGASDGPGVRYIIFLQGCPMRCKYCHNVDSRPFERGDKKTADELLDKAERCRSYWKNGGGITVSGGEPLCQIDFLTELFKKAKERNIHTTIDTSGCVFTKSEPFYSKFKELMKYTDLVMLDIKEINPERHKEIAGMDNENILAMARELSDMGKPMWIRHVLVPGYTDFPEDLKALGEFCRSLKSMERFQVLPYHTLGVFKWEKEGIDYPLKGVEPPTAEHIAECKRLIGINA